jgi:hypothetical protein
VFNRSTESDIVPAASDDLIAVVEERVEIQEDIRKETEKPLIAMAQTGKTSRDVSTAVIMDPPVEADAEIQPEIKDGGKSVSDQTDAAVVETTEVAENQISQSDMPMETEWIDEPEKKHISTSLVISGIAGTNNPQNRGGLKPLRAPGMLNDPVKSTVEQVGEETNYGLPVSVGLGVKLNFTKRWSLGIGLNYTLLTSSFNGKYTEVKDGVASMPISERVKNSQHYIGIPVNAYYNIISRDLINFYAYAGGTVEKCIGNVYQVQTTPVINHHEAVKGVQLSANVGIGVEFILGKHVGIYLDPSLRYYFTGSQPKSIRTVQPLMLGFEAGVRFNL